MRIRDWSSDVCSSDLSGKASFALDDDFTVFEMSDLASREELRSVVLSAIMFMTGQAMTRTSRATRKLLLIDEAWSMLKGGSMRSEERRVGKECVSSCSSGWSTYH